MDYLRTTIGSLVLQVKILYNKFAFAFIGNGPTQIQMASAGPDKL